MTLEKTLRAIIITGLFAIPFIVFVVASTMFFPYISGKNFLFRIIVEIIFVAWMLLALTDSSVRPKRSVLLLVVTAFIAIVAMANIFGENPYKSFWSNFERMEGLITLLHLFAYMLVWGTVLNSEKVRLWFWRVVIWVSAAVSVHALLQFFSTEKTRLDATLGNPIYLAVYVLFNIFIAAILISKRGTSIFERYALSAIILLELIVLYLTATRGATLGLVGGALLAAAGVALTERENIKLKKLAAGIVFAIFISMIGFLSIQNSEFVQNSPVLSRFANMSLNDGTVMARAYVWGVAWEGVKEKPILGWGQENFNLVFNKYYDPRMYAQEKWFDRTHNVVFDWLIAAGALGLLAYISIFFAILWILYKTQILNRTQKWIMVGLLAGYTFHNLTVFDNLISYILFFSIIAWMYALAPGNNDGRIFANKTLPQGIALKAGIPIGIVTALLLVWTVNADAYRTNKNLLPSINVHIPYARALAKNGNVKEAIEELDKAIEKFKIAEEYDSFGTQEVREQISRNIGILIREDWLPDDIKLKYLKYGIEAMERQKKTAPEDARFPVFLAALYMQSGNFDKEREELALARKLSPNKQHIILSQGINALNLNNKEEALKYFKEAYELDKTYAQAMYLYAKILIDTGKKDEAQKVLQEYKSRLRSK